MSGRRQDALAPNIALQRTPSASPPSPLSFGTLGGGKLPPRRIQRWGVLGILLASACHSGPSLKDYRVQLRETAGSGAMDCGTIMLGASKTQAVLCTDSALSARRPVFVAFQVMGFDSQIVHGLTVDGRGHALKFAWDSDMYGGRYRIASKSWIDRKPCAHPSVLDQDRPIKCL